MKLNLFFGLTAGVALLIASCGKDTGGCYKGEKAKVYDYSDSDTCGIVIHLVDEGKYIEATNLAEYSSMNLAHGDLLWVSYKPASGASLCGLGEIVELKCVNTRDY